MTHTSSQTQYNQQRPAGKQPTPTLSSTSHPLRGVAVPLQTVPSPLTSPCGLHVSPYRSSDGGEAGPLLKMISGAPASSANAAAPLSNDDCEQSWVQPGSFSLLVGGGPNQSNQRHDISKDCPCAPCPIFTWMCVNLFGVLLDGVAEPKIVTSISTLEGITHYSNATDKNFH